MAVIAPERSRTEAADLRSHLEAADTVIDALDPHRYSVEDTAELVGWLTRHERKVTALKTLAAARLAQGNLHVRSGHRNPAEFLAARTGDSVSEAKDLIALGENLADQPELADSFKKGNVSRRRATLVSRAARVNPGREADLVRSAETDSDATLKERCQRAKAEGRSREDEARHFRKLHEDRSCRTWTNDDGAFCLHAVLAPETGAGVLASLEAQTDRQFNRARHEGRLETHDAYRADALMALLTGKGIIGSGQKHRTERSTGSATSPTERTLDPRATVSVVVDLESLRRGAVAEGGRCEIPGVGPVGVDHARNLLGEALVELLIAKGTDVTTVYSAGRHIPKRVRSALLLRDPRCVVPGCDARLGLENDHWVTDFAKGGLTALDNLARVCRRHHRDRTHHGFELHKGPDGWVWIPPERPATPQRPKPKRKSTRTANAPPSAISPLFDEAPLHRQE
jgi:hypothetical protein